MNTYEQPFFRRYSVSVEQQALIDNAALTLVASQRHEFRLRVSKSLRGTVTGPGGLASDASLRIAINAARAAFSPVAPPAHPVPARDETKSQAVPPPTPQARKRP
jgi:hypothetical protein